MKRVLTVGAALAMTAWLGAAPSSSPVADAASKGDRDAVRTLLKQGADVSAAKGDGMTALHFAADRGDVAMTEMLVYAGANVAAVTRIGHYTPLHLASRAGNAAVAQALVKAGADVSARTTTSGVTPLHLAALSGNREVVTLLLDKGANPNLQLKRRPPYRDVPQDRGGDAILAQGATPLLRAARAGDAPFVKLLLEHKALVDLPSKEGVTPLMAAAGVDFGTRVTRGRNRTSEGVLATMQLLLDAGADINARMLTERRNQVPDGTSQAASYALVLRNRPSQVPTATAVPDQTALHGAAQRGYTPFVKFLVEHGAYLQAKDAAGRTPLDLAKGVGVPGVRQAAGEPFPETVALIEALLKK